MSAIIFADGRSVQADFSECILHTSGEFGGNLDFTVQFSEPVPTDTALQNLRLRLPGKEELLDVAGYGSIDRGLEITVFSGLSSGEEEVPASAVPPNVEVLWLEQSESSPVATLQVTVQAGDGGGQQVEDAHGLSRLEARPGCGTTLFAIFTVLLSFILGARN